MPLIPAFPKLTATSATDLAKSIKPKPASQALLKADQTPAEYLGALEEKKQSGDAIKVLAHGMSERDSVHFACESSQKVAGQMDPKDKEALGAAQAWVKDPSEATKAQAAAAASKTDFQGPGAWAAQAAAFSSPAGAAPAAGLTGHAASGSVMLAAAKVAKPEVKAPEMKVPAVEQPKLAMPDLKPPKTPTLAAPEMEAPELPPAEQAKVAEIHQPFIDLGKDVASGKNTWA